SCCRRHSAARTGLACGKEFGAMRSWVLAAGLLTAAATTGAQAADPYDGPPIPREPVYRDDDYGRDRGYYDGPRRYSHVDPRRPYAGHCLPREVVKEQLLRQGWHDFHDGNVQGDIATVHARRPSGRLFALAI